MSYNSKYTGAEVEELLDKVNSGEAGGGLPYYIVRSFNIDTILAAGTNNGIIEIDEQDGEEIYNAVAGGKVILIPKNPDDGFHGYAIASGYAEDMAYLTFTSDSVYFELYGRSNNFEFHKKSFPFVPEGATLGTVYKSYIFSVDFFLSVYNGGGVSQHQHSDEVGSMAMALNHGATIQIKDPMDGYIPLSASTNSETIWFTFAYDGNIYSGWIDGTEVACVKGYNQGVRDLSSQTDTHHLLPFVINRLKMDTTMQYQVDFLNPTEASNPEWKMQINCWDDGPAPISFPSTVVWANENTPTFEIDYIYELSFTQFVDSANEVYYFGVWSKWIM